MFESSNTLSDRVFQWCVDLLVWLAGVTGTTYKEITHSLIPEKEGTAR